MTADRTRDRSSLLHQEGEDFVRFLVREELIARLFCKGLKILYRTRIGSQDQKYLAALQLSQGLLGAQDGKRALEATHIQIPVESRHRRSCALEVWKLYHKPLT